MFMLWDNRSRPGAASFRRLLVDLRRFARSRRAGQRECGRGRLGHGCWRPVIQFWPPAAFPVWAGALGNWIPAGKRPGKGSGMPTASRPGQIICPASPRRSAIGCIGFRNAPVAACRDRKPSPSCPGVGGAVSPDVRGRIEGDRGERQRCRCGLPLPQGSPEKCGLT